MAEQVRNQGLDKFYTRPSIAYSCIEGLNKHTPLKCFDMIIEPSAGNGSFLDNLNHKNVFAVDIEPEDSRIIKMDFFDYNPDVECNILVIGNPPFGRNCSTAIRFFNHASKWSNCIAFIIPKTFRKVSIQNRLSNNFILISDIDIPDKPCSFEPTMNVKCCFQIWVRSANIRNQVILPTTHKDWIFLKYGPKDDRNQPTPPKGADFAIRAYGGKIGHIEQCDLQSLRPKSWHWIKSNICINTLIGRFRSLDFSKSTNTARQNSMGQKELIQVYSNAFDSKS